MCPILFHPFPSLQTLRISLCRGHWCHQRALLKTTQTRSIQADVITYNGLATAEGLPWRKALRGLEDSALQHLKAIG